MAFRKKTTVGAADFAIRVKCRETRIFFFTSAKAREAFKNKMKKLGCTVIAELYANQH